MNISKPYVNECNECVYIGNKCIELGFSKAKNGALVSILDKQTGYQFRRDLTSPTALYRLAIRHKDNREIEWFESSGAINFEWNSKEAEKSITLSLITSSFSGHQDLKVIIEVTLTTDSALSVWHMEVKNVAQSAVYQLICPILSGLVRLGDPAPGEALAVPVLGDGFLYRNPFPVRDRLPLCAGAGPDTADVGIGKIHRRYPGDMSIQMMAFYNDLAGLYLATHDDGENVKSFDIGQFADWGQRPVFSISHFPLEEIGVDVKFNYDTIIGIFHGDWHDAADIYKAWATKQWWCEKKLWERDIPDWMRTGVGVFQMSNYHIPKIELNHSLEQIVEVVNRLSKEAGVPLLALIFNWEGGGAWTGPKGFFPPREGEAEFKKAMQNLREAGNFGFVYIVGGCWYLKLPYDPPFDSWSEFEIEGRPNAIKDVYGEIPIYRLWSGWEATRLCPQPEYTKKLTTSLLLQCLDLGCTVVQIDCFPCGSEACYDPTHGHPLGFGPWWSKEWRKLLADVRQKAKAKYPNCAITTEGICENFIPYIDMFDQRAGNTEWFGHYARGMPMGGESIPIFSYVYNEYIGAYSAAYIECNRPEVLYWTRCLGKSLAQGVIPTGGWYFPEPAELNPVTINFYKKVVRAAARECWPYLMFGEMLRPPEINVPMITASYCKFFLDEKSHYANPKDRHEVQDRAVQHSAWRGPDGTIAYFFINVSEEPVTFDVELSAYAGNRVQEQERLYNVDRVIDGKREQWFAGISLPRCEKIEMEPLSVILVEIHERS